MVAGMAATRPSAVANSASAMPGATTAKDVFLEAAIDWKLVMMPQTVPNNPTKGPAEPTMAVLTTQCAFQNRVNSDRSDEVSGSTDCATSAGFMGTSLSA